MYSYAAYKDDFSTSCSPESISFSSRSMNIRALAKVLILATGMFLPLMLRNNFSLSVLPILDADNFGLTRAKNAGPKTMKYLSFWLTYILIWCNLYIFWVNGNNLKPPHSKMGFWDSLKNHWHEIFFRRGHRRCFIKKSILKNFAKFTGKHQLLCIRPATLLKKRL